MFIMTNYMMTHFDDQLHLYVLVHVDTLCCWSTKDKYDLSTYCSMYKGKIQTGWYDPLVLNTASKG